MKPLERLSYLAGPPRMLAVACVGLACATLIFGCSGYDPKLIGPADGAVPSADSGARDGSTAGDPDAQGVGDAGLFSDAGDAGQLDDSGLDRPIEPQCTANPNPSDECPEICDETCNGEDDDCDGKIDEVDGRPLCGAPHATEACSEGECLLIACKGRYGDCDHDASNGCETSLDAVDSCGQCNHVCDIDRAIAGCEGGECVPLGCERGYGDCDGDENTVCETEVVTASRCGSCDNACELDHALPECKALSCAVQRCDSGYDDCDGNAKNGCEARLDSLANCGACGKECEKASCAGGVCSAIVCSPPLADCDGDGADCEVDLATDLDPATDPLNCGACNAPCTFKIGVTLHATGLDCVDLKCAPVCDSGFGDCDPDYKNGCETPLTTAQNCGACGVNCDALLQNTSATRCAPGGVCAITTCDAGFEDCDGMDETGCEQSLHTVSNCGGCAAAGDNELCYGLPNVVTTVCTTGACDIIACEAGYADCDDVAANGCERNTAVEGPCAPDTNCTKRSYAGDDYYFCTNDSTWTAARNKCRLQARGDLVHIDDAAENAFLKMYRTADSWIGANDVGIEGLWRWSNDGVPFWRGGAAGTGLLSQYSQWSANEPNDNGGSEDCALMYAAGTWNDAPCGNASDFVCEISPDLCPGDSSKVDPGQCGCGTPDTDADNDGFATCNDACPADPNKVAGGVCGCGVADINTDGDSQLDCKETCDTDPNKLAPGVCGCGVPDTDTDGDTVADCIDDCPLNKGSSNSATGCGLGFAPTNFDVTKLNPDVAGASTTINCNAVLDTSSTPSFTTWCSGVTRPQITLHQQTGGGPELAVVAFHALTISSSRTLTIQGTRPAVFVVFGNATVSGIIDASASGTTAKAGGNFNCTANAAADSNLNGGDETGGGGGGGFGTLGGRGGDGDDSGGALGGGTRGTPSLVPLFGGCSGGTAGGCSGRGAGGGALQLSVGGTFTLASSGSLRANGGAGPNTCGGHYFGGGGGGSGGGIRVEAGSLSISGSVQANGAKGGDSKYNLNVTTTGGAGATNSSTNGGDGVNRNVAIFGGAGGGGGYGRVVLCNRTDNSGCP